MSDQSLPHNLQRLSSIRYCPEKAFITHEDITKAAMAAINENPENLPRTGLGVTLAPPQIALITGKKWKNGRVLVVGFEGGSTRVRNSVIQHARAWCEFESVTFDFSGSSSAEIRIAFEAGAGSWSYMGTDALSIPLANPTMNYGWFTDNTPDEEFRRVVVHEFGHALGAIHEHQHPDSGIPWCKKAVYEYYLATNGWNESTVNAQVFAKYDRDLLNASSYDQHSIMHYAIPADLLTDKNRAVGWNTDLSEGDKTFIAKEYPRGSGTAERPCPNCGAPMRAAATTSIRQEVDGTSDRPHN